MLTPPSALTISIAAIPTLLLAAVNKTKSPLATRPLRDQCAVCGAAPRICDRHGLSTSRLRIDAVVYLFSRVNK